MNALKPAITEEDFNLFNYILFGEHEQFTSIVQKKEESLLLTFLSKNLKPEWECHKELKYFVDGMTVLHFATTTVRKISPAFSRVTNLERQIKIIQTILSFESGRSLVNVKDECGYTPLYIGVKSQTNDKALHIHQALCTTLLLKNGADLLVKNFYNLTPFASFILHRNNESIKAIITHIAAISLKDLSKTLDFIPYEIVTIIDDYHSPLKSEMLNQKAQFCHCSHHSRTSFLGYAVCDLQTHLKMDFSEFAVKMKISKKIEKIIILLMQAGADPHEKAYDFDCLLEVRDTIGERLGSILPSTLLNKKFKDFFAEKFQISS